MENPSAEQVVEANNPAAGPTADQSGETSPDTLREEPNPSEESTRQEKEYVPYDKFRETNRKLKDAERLIEVLTTPVTTPSAPAQSSPAMGIPPQFLDEEGNLVDFFGYNQWSAEQAASRALHNFQTEQEKKEQFRRFEQSEREELYQTFPGVKDDPETMEMIESMKKGSLLRGQLVSLTDVASKYFKNLEKAAKQGKDEVIKTRTIQESAVPQPTVKPDASTQEAADIQSRMESPDPRVREKARLEYLIRLNKKEKK